jgi:hypothetical protein
MPDRHDSTMVAILLQCPASAREISGTWRHVSATILADGRPAR